MRPVHTWFLIGPLMILAAATVEGISFTTGCIGLIFFAALVLIVRDVCNARGARDALPSAFGRPGS